MSTLSSGLTALIREPTFLSAIAGAVVGGLVAYFLQIRALKESRHQRTEELKRIQEMLGTSILFKAVKILSNAHELHSHLGQALSPSDRLDSPAEPWQVLVPLASLPNEVHFSSEEMSMLLSIGDTDIFNLVFPLDTVHSSMLNSTRTLFRERSLLLEQCQPQVIEGTMATGEFATEELLRLRPRMVAVNELARQLEGQAGRLLKESRQALELLQSQLREKLNLNVQLEEVGRNAEP